MDEKEAPKKPVPKPQPKTVKEKDDGDDEDEDKGLAQLAQKKKTKFFRALTEPEEGMDLVLLQESFDDLEKQLAEKLADIVGVSVERVKPRLERIIKDGNLSQLIDLSVLPKGDTRRVLKDVILDSYQLGKKTSSKEMGVSRPPTPLRDVQTISFDASELASQMKAEIDNKVKQTAKESIAKKINPKSGVSAAINAALATATTMISNLAGFTVGENINRGRRMVFEDNMSDISGFQRTEILDEKTCNLCLSLDLRIVKADDPIAQLGAVHSNCRGQWIALRVSEFDKQKEAIAKGVIGIPNSVTNSFNTVGGVPVINSFTQLKKPVNQSNKDVQAVIKKKSE
ncbi:MAG: hypothetical protein V3T43_06075, partial [Nitrosomonadaceae bacterium]